MAFRPSNNNNKKNKRWKKTHTQNWWYRSERCCWRANEHLARLHSNANVPQQQKYRIKLTYYRYILSILLSLFLLLSLSSFPYQSTCGLAAHQIFLCPLPLSCLVAQKSAVFSSKNMYYVEMAHLAWMDRTEDTHMVYIYIVICTRESMKMMTTPSNVRYYMADVETPYTRVHV